MKSRLHAIALVLFAISFLFDIIVWGAVDALGEVGENIADSARREAPLATTYIAIGGVVDSVIPPLRGFGDAFLSDALSPGFDRIRDGTSGTMDLVFGPSWNAAHGWLKTMYWATPVTLLLAVVLWTRRPRAIRTIRR